MVAIAEFGNRFAADVASARLTEAGIDSTVLGDPAAAIAPHHITERWFSLCVRAEAADHAREALADPVDATHRSDVEFVASAFRDRPRWIRVATWALILAIPVPLLVSLVLVLLVTTRSLFP
ncbi:MAG: hypothetical protein OEW42_02345 [Acidimicrobiia bacterium]|nr:hypothetical protein [Acidimicrobiia bacterium]MDH5237669.1 hypothetical protein [Acidimicrobiia bacterium]